MNKQPQLTDATREAFVTAFFRLAQTRELRQITVREVAALAGYNRSTFYRYFEDVFALLACAEEDLIRRIHAALSPQGCIRDDEAFWAAFLDCIRENAPRASILLSEQNRAHFIRRIREASADILGVPLTDTPRKRVVTDMFFSGVFAATALHLQNAQALPEADLLEIVGKLFRDWYWPQIMENQDREP